METNQHERVMEEKAGRTEGGRERARQLTQLEGDRGDMRELCASTTTVVGDPLGHLAAL